MRIEEVVGKRVREAREAQEMTQEEFGQRMGVLLGKPWPRQAVSLAEKGQRSFAAAELLATATVLGCEVADLFRVPADVEAVTMPSGAGLTREQLRQNSEAGRPSAEALRGALRDLVVAAESLQAAGFATERRARQLHDDLDRLLVDVDRRE